MVRASCKSTPKTAPSKCHGPPRRRRRRPAKWRATSTSAPRRRRKRSPAKATWSATSRRAGRSFPRSRTTRPENLRALKPEQRMDELKRQIKQRTALNEKLAALVAKRDKFVAEARDKTAPKGSSFDRVVEDTLKAQIKK